MNYPSTNRSPDADQGGQTPQGNDTEMLDRMSSSAGSYSDDFVPGDPEANEHPTRESTDGTVAAKAATGTAAAIPATGTASAATDVSSVLKDQWRSRYGETVPVPEDLTQENLFDKVEQLSNQNISPEARRLNDLLQNGGSIDDYIEERGQFDRLINMSDEELIAADLRNRYGKSADRPNGWDEDKINKSLEAKKSRPDELAEKAQDIRELAQSAKAKRDQEMAAYGKPQAVDFNDPKVIARFDKAIEEGVADIVKDGNLYGITLSKDELSTLPLHMKKLMMADPETGIAPGVKNLYNGKDLMKAALLLDLAEKGRIRLAVSEGKEGAKRTFLDLLDSKPNEQTSAESTGAIPDINKLAAPSQLG